MDIGAGTDFDWRLWSSAIVAFFTMMIVYAGARQMVVRWPDRAELGSTFMALAGFTTMAFGAGLHQAWVLLIRIGALELTFDAFSGPMTLLMLSRMSILIGGFAIVTVYLNCRQALVQLALCAVLATIVTMLSNPSPGAPSIQVLQD